LLAAEKLEIAFEASEALSRKESEVKTAIKPSSVSGTKHLPRFYKIVMVLMVCAIFAGGVHFYSLAVGITAKGYELNKLKAEVKELAVTNERIRLEISKEDSLERVEAIAVTELGMRKPLVEDYLLLADNANWSEAQVETPLAVTAETEKEKQFHADSRPLFQQKVAALLAVVLEKNKS